MLVLAQGVPRGRPGKIQPEVILRELPFKVRVGVACWEPWPGTLDVLILAQDMPRSR